MRDGHRLELDEIGRNIVDAALQVHRALGPGLLESAYQYCLAFELETRGFRVQKEVALPLFYKGHSVSSGYRIDMIVDNLVIVENKTVDQLLPIHEAQLLTYLKLKPCKLGFLLNWHVPVIKNGIKRMVLEF